MCDFAVTDGVAQGEGDMILPIQLVEALRAKAPVEGAPLGLLRLPSFLVHPTRLMVRCHPSRPRARARGAIRRSGQAKNKVLPAAHGQKR